MAEFMSLAQHHGVPTRLLDFTFNPYVACYFAAIGNKNLKKDSYIAIWAIHKDAQKCVPRMEFYEPLRSKNRYLHAQDGLFILDRGINGCWDNGPPNFDMGQIVVENFNKNSEYVKSFQFLGIEIIYKFVLPAIQVDKLLFTLENRGINPASIAPSFENVVKSLELQRERKIKLNTQLKNAYFKL
jgi:hypothetical protein